MITTEIEHDEARQHAKARLLLHILLLLSRIGGGISRFEADHVLAQIERNQRLIARLQIRNRCQQVLRKVEALDARVLL